MKKIFILFAMLLLSLSVIGCDGNKTKYDPDNFLETGDKIVKEKIELTFFAPLHSLHTKEGYNAMKLFKIMEEVTNIHINWVYGNVSNYDEIRASQWTSKNRPDAFFLWNSTEEVVKYGENGTIYELTDYIKDYAPNYQAILDNNPEYKKAATFNGKMYSTLAINDVPRDQTFKQFINQKWLENLGLDMPTNTDELYTVLKAFKTEDPNGNGINDEIPLSSASLNQTRNFLMSAFGYVSTGMEMVDGQAVFVPTTNNYRAYLEFANKLFEEKLLDNNTFTMDERALAAKGSLVGCFDGSAAYLIAGEANDANYSAIAPLTSSINSEKMWLGFNTVSPSAIIIPKTSPYVKEIVRWIDFLYSEQGIMLQAFGEENVDFTWKDDSKTSFTFNVPSGMNIEEFRGTLTPSVGLGVVTYFSRDFVLKEDNEYTSRINQVVEEANYMDYLKVPVPDLLFTKEEQNRLAIIETDLEIYMAVFEQKMISGKEDINDSTWSAHLDNLKKLKVEELINIYNAAYQRYLLQ